MIEDKTNFKDTMDMNNNIFNSNVYTTFETDTKEFL